MPDTLQSLLTEAQKAGELPETVDAIAHMAECRTVGTRFYWAERMAIELLTAVVERERMLREAWSRPWPLVNTNGGTIAYEAWLADLKARSQEVT